MPSPEDNAKTVNRYLELVAKGNADDIAALYAEDATVEDPVGGEVHIGREAVRGFYRSVPTRATTQTELCTLRALGQRGGVLLGAHHRARRQRHERSRSSA